MSIMDDVRVAKKLIEAQIEDGTLITLEEAALRLGVSKQHIRRYREGGVVSVHYGRKVYVSAAGVERYHRERNTKRGRPPKGQA